MEDPKEKQATGMTRRDALRISGLGLAVGGLAIGGAITGPGAGGAQTGDDCGCPEEPACSWADNPKRTQRYSYFEKLDKFYPFSSSTSTTIRRLRRNEMRITFMGSSIPLNLRRVQQMMSVFVEVGWNDDKDMPLDQFVFDCGSGVCTNYTAMNVGLGRMDKIFINHLHGDHMSDLTHIYCFGPAGDRKSPLYVWGPGRSGVESPEGSGKYYNDGTRAFCKNLRRACRWHTESFSFQSTSYSGYPTPAAIKEQWGLPGPGVPTPVEDDPWGDAYALVPIELDWRKTGFDTNGKPNGDNIAYNNPATGVKITHFPVIHARKGSVGYKLEWKCPDGDVLSMIYTSDTRPETLCVEHARNGGKGVDVFIHEMIVPAQIWTMKMSHLNVPPDPETPGVKWAQMVQNSSHSPQGAFGYLLGQIEPRPRLTVATHFPVANDTVECAMKSVKAYCDVYQGKPKPQDGKNPARITWSFDLMVVKVTRDEIVELKGEVSDFEYSATVNLPPPFVEDPNTPANPPKYWTYDENGKVVGDPEAQIDTSREIPACENGKCNYRDDGY